MKISLSFLALITLTLLVGACSDQQRVYPSAPQGGPKKIAAAQTSTRTLTQTSTQTSSETSIDTATGTSSGTSTQTSTQASTAGLGTATAAVTATDTATNSSISDLKDRPCQDLSSLSGTWTLETKTEASSTKRVSILSPKKTKDGSLKYSSKEILTIKKPNRRAQNFRGLATYFYEPDRCVVTRTIGSQTVWHKLSAVKKAEKEFIVDYQICMDISCSKLSDLTLQTRFKRAGK